MEGGKRYAEELEGFKALARDDGYFLHLTKERDFWRGKATC